jgi:hypothetical protein
MEKDMSWGTLLELGSCDSLCMPEANGRREGLLDHNKAHSVVYMKKAKERAKKVHLSSLNGCVAEAALPSLSEA